jgi:hypothetical protein
MNMDILFILIIFVFFAAAALFTRGCDQLSKEE